MSWKHVGTCWFPIKSKRNGKYVQVCAIHLCNLLCIPTRRHFGLINARFDGRLQFRSSLLKIDVVLMKKLINLLLKLDFVLFFIFWFRILQGQGIIINMYLYFSFLNLIWWNVYISFHFRHCFFKGILWDRRWITHMLIRWIPTHADFSTEMHF